MKIRLPRSRRRFTQPRSTTLWPESAGRKAPHIWVRRRSPRKSSKLCPSVQDAALSRIKDYKWWERLQPHAGLQRVVQLEIFTAALTAAPSPQYLDKLPGLAIPSVAPLREESAVSLPAERIAGVFRDEMIRMRMRRGGRHHRESYLV